ncbi:MAG: hypothetical protein R2792_14720 [Saprospiraceae bacterium]
METRLNFLVGLINKYPVESISKLYRDTEVNAVVDYFTKYPNVKWSEALKKKELQKAQRLRISPGRMLYLQELIENINAFEFEAHIEPVKLDINRLLAAIYASGVETNAIRRILIGFSTYTQRGYIHLYGDYTKEWWENKLADFALNFESVKIWKFLESNKFYTLSELLEVVEVEGEEYPQLFVEIWELRVFQLFKLAFNEPEIRNKLFDQRFKNLKIEVGIRGNNFNLVLDI